jgi:hypothetical protein
MDTCRLEQEQGGIWTPGGWSKNRVEYGHVQSVARTGRNIATNRADNEQGRIWTFDNYRVAQPTGRKNAS